MDLSNDKDFMNANSGYDIDKKQDYNHGMNWFMRRVLFVNCLKTSMIINEKAYKNVNGEGKIKEQYGIQCEDCPDIIDSDQVCGNTRQLSKSILQSLSTNNQNEHIADYTTIRNSLIKYHRSQIILTILYFFLQIMLRFIFIALLSQLLNKISLMQIKQTLFIANICGFLLITGQIFRQNGLHQATHLLAVIKNQLLFLTFCKISKLSNYTAQQMQIGNIINIFQSDFKSLQVKVNLLLAAIPTLIPTALFIYILYQQIGYFAFIAVLILIFFFIFQVVFAKLSVNIRQKLMLQRDQRLKVSSEVIQNIKHIKIYGWELAFENVILKLREKQLFQLLKFYIVKSIDRCVIETSIYIATFVSLYAVDKSPVGYSLTTEKMIISICIFFVLKVILAQFGLGAMFIFQLRVIVERICKILNTKSVSLVAIKQDDSKSNSQVVEKQLNFGEIKFQNFYGYWKEDGSSKQALQNINLHIQPRNFIGVTGKVGSGKSTLLAAILGEIPYCSGRLSKKGTVAYVEQEPFIMSATIEQNVIFGKNLNKVKYEQALKRACLNADLLLFQHGDQTVVGERGITLSGGQKARISLARALYSDSDIYLFDDPLSAVDSNVARSIYEHVILHLRKSKTVILVTHQISYLSECDTVLIMKDCQIIQRDRPSNLVHILESLTKEEKSMQSIIFQSKSKISSGDETLVKKKNIVKQPQMSLYQYCLYSKINYLIAPFTLIGYVVSQILLGFIIRVLSQYSITKMGKSSYFNSLQQFWLFLIIMFGVYVIINVIKYFGTYLCLINTNKKLYENAVDRLLRAPCSYYDVTSLGDVAIRLSDNLIQIQTEFTFFLITSIQGPLNILMILTNVSLIDHIFIIPAAISLFIIIFGFCYLDNCLSQTKKLAISTKATIISKVLQTFHGLTQISIYNKRLSLINQFARLLNNSLRATRCFGDVFRVFVAYSSYIFCLVVWIAYLIGIFNLKQQETWLYFYSVGLLFGLTDSFRWYSLHLVTMLGLRVNIYKVAYLTYLTSEKSLLTNYDETHDLIQNKNTHFSSDKSNLWIKQNMSIRIQNLSLRYQPDLSLVLHGISFDIRSKEKVGIVGRTGSGKSSIVQALLRLYEPEKGSVYQIGGFDALQMGLHTLRHNISVIPQTPFLFKGTVRKNLDPFDSHSDEDIWRALEQSSLRETIEKVIQNVTQLPHRLDTVFINSAQVLSIGQKQLLCLARALLRRSSVLILDEATSNVDMVSDEFIQRCIKKYFSDSIVITIAHRLHTVADYDKIFVIEKGRIIEMGAPHELIMKQGAFSKMVDSTGAMAEQIRRISREAYQK